MTTQVTTKPTRERPSIEEIEDAASKAVQDAILMHKKLGIPIVVWEDGQVVEIPPEKIEVLELKS